MIDGSVMSTAAKWEQAGKAVGRSVIACKRRFKILHHSRKHIQVADDRESLVTSEVQGQFELSSAVDWPQVSQATGLGMRECLELSQYDGGKASWHYDPDSFSQSMVDRMTGFIEEHYPTPTPVSYRAVSNFMWVDMNDCIRIHDMLRGKFNWTEAGYERAVALRAQGLTYREVARHLSPTLTHSSVCNALQFYLSPKIVREPISADELEEINRLADEYAGKYPVVETIDKIRTQLNLSNRRGWHSTVSRLLAARPHYQAKLSGFDYIDLANRIATGQTTTKLAAKELDVPRLALEIHVSDMNSRLFSSAWTGEETRKLLDYVQTSNSKPDYLPVESRLDEIRDLVHLRLEHNFGCDRSSYLAQRNAQTPQSLCFKSRYFHDKIDLIRNPDGGYVTYPCLHTLELWEYKMSGCRGLPAFSGAVPFPSLWCLRTSLPALLGDDTLFRESSATLESLVLRLDDYVVPMFCQHSVFTPTSHPKLLCIRLERLDRLVPEPFSTYTEVVRFVLSIGPGAPVQGIEEVPSADELLPALSLPGDHSSIQVLSIPNTELDIWQAISLIKSLPLLSDLQALFPSIGSMPDGVTMNELPEYMVSTYAPMGERFRCWRIIYYTSNIENIMLLALICPNFDYAAAPAGDRELFMAHMRDNIQADGFKQHE
ncbi:hypothetical protein GGI19_000518 [Coemansia pectinata]|uniref:Uncharacterized protein n=1 Tax=Coemansia pectinata TaxID=1052879 RepID=A0A9W8LE40_9FUNG|nr:hypothetical protein GGI19_000518 [Coemansia pectinata]